MQVFLILAGIWFGLHNTSLLKWCGQSKGSFDVPHHEGFHLGIVIIGASLLDVHGEVDAIHIEVMGLEKFVVPTLMIEFSTCFASIGIGNPFIEKIEWSVVPAIRLLNQVKVVTRPSQGGGDGGCKRTDGSFRLIDDTSPVIQAIEAINLSRVLVFIPDIGIDAVGGFMRPGDFIGV